MDLFIDEFWIRCLGIVRFCSVFIRSHSSRISSILTLRSPAFSKVSMIGDKFAFSENSLSLVATARGLVKSRCERQRITRCGGMDSSEERRDRLGAGVRAANVEIQPGGYF